MATDVDVLKAEVARIEGELEQAKRRLARAANGEAVQSGPPPLAGLRGILKGRVHFTEEDIASLKIGSRDKR